MAAPHGNAQAAMIEAKLAVTFLHNLEAEPWRFDYFAVLRHLERMFPDRPRIGDSATRRDEFVRLGQDPFMDFPASNLARVVRSENKPLQIIRQVSGPAGAAGRAAALDHRRDLSLHARAATMRFPAFSTSSIIGSSSCSFAPGRIRARSSSMIVPTPTASSPISAPPSASARKPYQNLDSVPDAAKLGFAGLLGAQAKCASRLAGAVCGLFKVKAEVEEFVGTGS